MNRFYFNECIPGEHGIEELSNGLCKLLIAYNRLTTIDKLQIVKGWICASENWAKTFCGHTLQDIVNGIQSKDAKNLFYATNINYPVEDYFSNVDVEALLENGYTFAGMDAINLAIVGNNHGLLLSLPVAEELKHNSLEIQSSREGINPIMVLNLYGNEESNTKFICKEMLHNNYKEAENGIDKLQYLAPKVVMSEAFKRKFENCTNNDLCSIFNRFDEAISNDMLSPLRSDGTIIKNVEKHVAELRVVNPVAIRVYFHVDGVTMYFAKMAYKNEYHGTNGQNKDIQDAEKIIQELILKGNKTTI